MQSQKNGFVMTWNKMLQVGEMQMGKEKCYVQDGASIVWKIKTKLSTVFSEAGEGGKIQNFIFLHYALSLDFYTEHYNFVTGGVKDKHF